MTISDPALEWLRAARATAAGPHADDRGPVAAAVALGLLARRTPAWTEQHVAALGDLLARTPAGGALHALVAGLRHDIDATADTVAAAGTVATTATVATSAPAGGGTEGDAESAEGEAEPAELALAGLAALLHDRHHDTARHAGALARLHAALDRAGAPPHAADALWLAVLVAPQAPETARHLFDDARRRPLGAAPEAAAALVLAREWGLTDLQPELRQRATSSDDPLAAALVAAADAAGPEPGRLSALFTTPLARWPQVVDVEVPAMALRRAEWVHDCLCLTLAPAAEQPTRFTQFRIVGTELRVWCQTGVDGVRTDVTGHGVIVRAPLVSGPLEFTPGSY